MPGNLVVDVGALTKPATVLIEKISAAVGGIAEPYQIERIAKAEAKSELIRAKSEIEIADLRLRALNRFAAEETRKQQNMESIVRRALPRLTADSEPDRMDDDWITNFFERARIVSDEDMQELWSRVLAGEANNTGSFSRKTINVLHDMDGQAADLFRTICGFSWSIAGEAPHPLVYLNADESRAIYGARGINLSSLMDLQALGLLSLEPLARRTNLPPTWLASYFGDSIEATLSGRRLRLGEALLTASGRQLAAICNPEPVDGFFEFVRTIWEGESEVTSLKVLQLSPSAGSQEAQTG